MYSFNISSFSLVFSSPCFCDSVILFTLFLFLITHFVSFDSLLLSLFLNGDISCSVKYLYTYHVPCNTQSGREDRIQPRASPLGFPFSVALVVSSV